MKKIAQYLAAFGIHIYEIKKSLQELPKFLRQLYKFKKVSNAKIEILPYLFDYNSEAGCARGHYFHQDLLVAKFINKSKPKKHIDYGSRIDGFVAHVASFRKIEVVDIRELKIKNQPTIIFKKMDLMKKAKILKTDSASCLHAIEHFGLGRYGDKLNPNGHFEGFITILETIKIRGILYISFPISWKPRVVFNAHRIFSPCEIFSWPTGRSKISLERFDYIDDEGLLHLNKKPTDLPKNSLWGCGIYTFRKTGDE
jgi:hypothetical protein